MSYNDRQSYKSAYHEFQAAARLKPGDPTIEQMLKESYDAALTRVVILPANDYGVSYSSYNYQLRNYDNDIFRVLQNAGCNEFVKFYSSAEAQTQNIIPDEYVETHFTQINLGRINDTYSTKEVSKDVVVKETVYKPDSVIQQFGKVKATITTTQRTIYSEGIMGDTVTLDVHDDGEGFAVPQAGVAPGTGFGLIGMPFCRNWCAGFAAGYHSQGSRRQ